MDAVVKGLIAGAGVSALLFFTGIISLSTAFGDTFKNPNFVGFWLIILTALTAGQIVLSAMIVSAFAEAPVQTTQSGAQSVAGTPAQS